MFTFVKNFLIYFSFGMFSVISTSVVAEYDSKQKEMMSKESEELSNSNKSLATDKQVETTGTKKVEQKLHDREEAAQSSESSQHRDQDRAGKTIEEKRDVNSDGPRADGNEDTPLETQKSLPAK